MILFQNGASGTIEDGGQIAVRARSFPVTTEQLLALPGDDKERWLIAGEVREKQRVWRSRGHGRTLGKLTYLLHGWIETQARPRGEVLGRVDVCLRRSPDTSADVDVAYFFPETGDSADDDADFVEAVPVLVAEIVSLDDRHGDISERVRSYMDAGVRFVWKVDPAFRTVIAYRSGAEPEQFNATQTINGEPHLPGFSVAVKEIFSR